MKELGSPQYFNVDDCDEHIKMDWDNVHFGTVHADEESDPVRTLGVLPAELPAIVLNCHGGTNVRNIDFISDGANEDIISLDDLMNCEKDYQGHNDKPEKQKKDINEEAISVEDVVSKPSEEAGEVKDEEEE